MRILYITDYFPYPPFSGDRLRIYNLIQRVAEVYPVVLATLFSPEDDQESISRLKERCLSLEMGNHRWRHPWQDLSGFLEFTLQGKPFENWFLYSQDFAHRIHELVGKGKFDIVHIEHSRMAHYVEAIPRDRRLCRLLTLHNIAFEQYPRIVRVTKNPYQKTRTWLYGRAMKSWEATVAREFDCCITVSEHDRMLLNRLNPHLRVEVIPNGVDTSYYQPAARADPASPVMLFVGSMSYAPCEDAAFYFHREILPRIQQRIGRVQIWFVGANPSKELVNLSSSFVHVTGRVEDVLPFYRQASVCVVPLRAGGGTRLKILEAMALGRPVVSTSIGCEGLEVVDGQHLFIADDAERFAERVIRLLIDPTIYQAMTAQARQLVVNQYDWDRIANRLMQIYEQISDSAGDLQLKSRPADHPARIG